MHQRNVTLCVQACACLCVCWERPCVLTLPIVFTATRLAICSEAQTGLCVLLWADAAIRSGWLSSPSVAPCSSCFSSGEMGLCLVFCVGREGGWLKAWCRSRGAAGTPNTIAGCFGPLHFTGFEEADLSQLRAGRTGCCSSRCDPPPSLLWSLARYSKTTARTIHPLYAHSERQGSPSYYNLAARFLGSQQKIWQIDLSPISNRAALERTRSEQSRFRQVVFLKILTQLYCLF